MSKELFLLISSHTNNNDKFLNKMLTSDDFFDDVERHIGETYSILGHRDHLLLRAFFFR